MAQIDSAELHWAGLRDNFAQWAPVINQFFYQGPEFLNPLAYPKLQRAGTGAFGTVLKVISPETFPNKCRPRFCSKMVASSPMP